MTSSPPRSTMNPTAATTLPSWRRLPIGAEPAPSGGVHFRVWAPRRRSVDVVLESPGQSSRAGSATPLDTEGNGYFSGLVRDAAAGTRYRFRLDGGDAFPDPASRYQPDGPHGASEVVDPTTFRWTDAGWKGPSPVATVIYEMHIGTFTQEGTWAAATRELDYLAELGITLLEVMPVSEFPGRFGWGYDGVDLFAPYHVYGTPDQFRAFVDRAHALGLAVILDVVRKYGLGARQAVTGR